MKLNVVFQFVALILLVVPSVFAQDLVIREANGIASTVTTLAQRSTLTVDGKLVGSVVTDEIEQDATTGKVQLIQIQSEASRIVVSADNVDRIPVEVLKLNDEYYIVNGKGKVWVTVQAVDFEKQIFEQARMVLQLEAPEDLTPDTKPPIDKQGLHVLIVVESEDIATMPPQQREILFNLKTRVYLNRRCVLASDGTPSWRVLDQDTEFPDVCDSVWCKTLARDRTEVPWLVVSNGKTGIEMPLPKTMEEFIAVVEKF